MIQDLHRGKLVNGEVASRGPRPRRPWGPTGLAFRALLALASVGAVAMFLGQATRALRALPYFEITSVQVEGNLQVPAQEVIDALHLPPHTSILEADLRQLARRAMEHPWVKEAWVTRRLPASLTIRIVERVPETVLVADQPYLLSADGVVLDRLGAGELPALPILRAPAERHFTPADQVLRPEIARGLAVWRDFQLANGLPGDRTREIRLAPDGSYEVSLGPGMPVVRLRGDDLEGQLNRLARALRLARVGMGTFGSIDLRFGEKVILKPLEGQREPPGLAAPVAGREGGTLAPAGFRPGGGDGSSRAAGR